MTTAISSRHQTLVMTEVTKVQVTAIEDDSGTPTRAIRIYGDLGPTFPPTLEIIISAEEAETLKITTPELVY